MGHRDERGERQSKSEEAEKGYTEVDKGQFCG